MIELEIEHPELLKKKIIRWADQFEHFCLLNSNHYQDKHSVFEWKIGIGAKQILKAQQGSAFEDLKKFNATKESVLFGYLAYDLKNEVEKLSSANPDHIHAPDLFFFEPEHLIEIRGNKLYITDTELFEAILNHPTTSPDKETNIHIRSRINKAEYCEQVERIKQHIADGDVYELNFCQEFYAAESSIDPVETYWLLNERSPMPFSSLLKNGAIYTICASPERFLQKQGKQLISQPIKGTIKRGQSPAEDQRLQSELAGSIKERAENVMIVDLVRNDLKKSSKTGSIKVEELFGIYTFNQLHQMISTISSELKDNTDPVDAIRLAFPMGSMTGAPKVRSMQLIEQYESSKRGIYSGAIGYIDCNNDFDLNVVIRSINYNKTEQYLSFHVGSAITYDSDAEYEYDECLLKARAIIEVLTKK